MTFDPLYFEPSARRFRHFFEELREAFIERDDVLTQVALALLAREHVLLVGPPGTAKSQLATAVFGRIIDEATGRPSLYSRQIGESTVRTDLVGPIDFKTLMESGRSEHFTDEGMLGAVHGFLDEIFDGRDMLLRDALNVLQERELKQGTKIVKGQIECALMTSNRYLAEILENSRETLLAFVDRIAFVGFVPRGFADEAALADVLRRHAGRRGGATLSAPLTIQDLDCLQAAADHVAMSDGICERLAMLLRAYDAELLTASRADPSFVPTRYLSTRTAVRAGKLLRSIVVLRRATDQPRRPMAVQPDDLAMLRLHLVLSGPTPDAVENLLPRERDPRERRQLEIIRTERMLFDRCFAALPDVPSDGRVDSVEVDDPDAVGAVTAMAHAGTSAELLEAVREVLGAVRSGRLGILSAERALARSQAALAVHARRAAWGVAATDGATLDDHVAELTSLADEIERDAPNAASVARWLRGQALFALDGANAVTAMPSRNAATLHDASALDRARRRLAELVEREATRSRIKGRGVDGYPNSAEGWRKVVSAAEAELAGLWDEAVALRLASALEGVDPTPDATMRALAPALRELREVEAVLRTLGGGGRFAARVLGPRLTDVFDRAIRSTRFRARRDALFTIERFLGLLEDAELASAVDAERWADWTATALLSVPPGPPPRRDVAPGEESFRRLLNAEEKTSFTYAVALVTLRADASSASQEVSMVEREARVARTLARLLPATQRAVVAADEARLERALSALEAWWTASHATGAEMATFVRVAWEERALLRLALEARAVAAHFPAHAESIAAIEARIRVLDGSLATHASERQRAAADEAFRAVLGTRS